MGLFGFSFFLDAQDYIKFQKQFFELNIFFEIGAQSNIRYNCLNLYVPKQS